MSASWNEEAFNGPLLVSLDHMQAALISGHSSFKKKIIPRTISGLLSLECLHVHKQINKLENIEILNDNDDSMVCSTKRSQNR